MNKYTYTRDFAPVNLIEKIIGSLFMLLNVVIGWDFLAIRMNLIQIGYTLTHLNFFY